MIIDRTWNRFEKKLVISYLDKNGNRAFWQKYFHHIKTYEYDKEGEFTTWNGRKCRSVYKDTTNYTPNEFDILDIIYELPEEQKKEIQALRWPRLYFADIETEVSDEFPDPEKAEQRIQLISLVGPDMSVIVFGLKKMSEEKINSLKEQYLDWLHNNEFAHNLILSKKYNPRVFYVSFDTEKDLLTHWFTKIMPKIAFLAGWNFYRFDWQYMINRLINLFGKAQATNIVKAASPTKSLSKISWSDQGDTTKHSIMSPEHCAIFDYMELIKSYEFSLRPYESYSLDWVGSHGINAHKVKYEGSFKQLYENDYDLFVFYNAIDSALGELLHYRFKCIQTPCASGSVTNVPVMKAMGQVALTTANLYKRFYEDKKKVVYEPDAIDRTKIPYEGAFCGCVPGLYEYNVCDDFASLYPSQIITCSLSPETIVENKVGPDSLGRYTIIPWTEDELEKFRQDPNYFVTVMGTVYDLNGNPAFPRLQADQKALRNKYKYIGWKIDGELLPALDKLIKEKESA